MKIFFANLHPCNTRKVNVRQCYDFVKDCNHKIVTRLEDAEIILVWACEFRGDWRDFSYSVVEELKENYPARVVYMGCTFGGKYISRIESELGVTVVPWNDRTNKLENLFNEHQKKLNNTALNLAENKLVDNVTKYREKHPYGNVCFEDEYVKLSICEGCTNNCAYCSEKQMFPPFRSFPEDQLIRQCKKALRSSHTDQIMFLADSTGEYGKDTGSSLPQLIKKLKKNISKDIKVGISQLNPEHFIKYENEMIQLIQDGTIKYMNIPIQSASDRILSSMRRKYTSQELERIFAKFKKIKFDNFSTHLILGYPSESIKDVQKSIGFIIKYPPKHVVVSAFMTHPSIPASNFEGQIDKAETDRRIQLCVKELTKKGIKVATDWNAVTNKLMNRIRYSLGLSLKNYQINMINCRQHLNKVSRTRQEYLTRQNIIRLGMNEYVPSMPPELFREILKDFTVEIASAYPEVNQAYSALSTFLKQPRDRILLTHGADTAIRATLETFCDPGDTILTVSHTFAMYGIHASLLNCIFKEVYCDSNGKVSINKLISSINPGVKAVIIANPNGVTGYELSISEIKKLIEKAVSCNTLVIIDEAYADFGNIDTSNLIDKYSNLVIIRSFSKNIGFAGLRIGYIITNEQLASMIEKMRPMMELNSLAVKAVVTLCNNPEYLENAIKVIIQSRKKFTKCLSKMGFTVIERQGNFILVNFGDRRDIILKNLNAKNIEFKILPPPLGKFVRITVGTEKVMSFVIRAIKNALR